MRIAIVTLPLHTNYGGILQAYALKRVLEGFGHEVCVLDLKDKMPLPEWWKAPFVYAGRGVKRIFMRGNAPEVFRELRFRKELPVLAAETGRFVEKYISPRLLDSYSDVQEGDYDAFVVGSDQVWRPRYFHPFEDAFLRFTKGWKVRRLSYAASFGTDALEYEYMQLAECAGLLAAFDGVSVREESAVTICDEWFDCDRAVHVLDPVMLLDSGDYIALAETKQFPQQDSGCLITYLLDTSIETEDVADFVVRCTGMEKKDISPETGNRKLPLNSRVAPPVEQWLAEFSEAGFVITDSFHACVLAILFHKPFLVIGNVARGQARLNSLLSMFGLESRLVQGLDPDDDGDGWLMEIDWAHVDEILECMREKSITFLRNGIGSEK